MVNIKKRKKAIAMSFNWIFAIIAGGFILFLAIYAAVKLINIGQLTTSTETSASLVSLFDPLETGLASGKASEISFVKQSKLSFDCDEQIDNFGVQYLSFAEKTFGDKYGTEGERIVIRDKYVFTDNILEGKRLYYFTKPFFIGFKVTDLLMMYTEKQNYCIYNADDDFIDEIEGLNLKNIYFPNSSEKCEGMKICFGGNRNCDTKIHEDYVLKNGKRLYYDGELLYAAIFSSPEIYECNIKRIKRRYNELANIYLKKIEIIKRKECEPTLGPKLSASINIEIKNSKDLVLFNDLIKDIDSINKRANEGCKLYYNV